MARMTTAALERTMVRRIKDGDAIDPRVLAKLDDGGPVGAGRECAPASEAFPRRRKANAR